MDQIIIVDDNNSKGAFLKQVLEREDHQVIHVPCETNAVFRFKRHATNLVMINHTCREHSGWQIFNHVKLFYPEIPLMLYFLDSFRLADTDGIIQAVTQALRHSSTPIIHQTGQSAIRSSSSRFPETDKRDLAVSY